MTIRDIGILFGYKVDESSERKVEGSIKSLKSMASKVLGAVGITLSVAGIKSAIDGCVEVASSIEEITALKSVTPTFPSVIPGL